MITVKDAAKIVGGAVIGDGSIPIRALSAPRYAGDGDITFITDAKDAETVAASGAACVMSTVDLGPYPKTVIKVSDIKSALTILFNALAKTKSVDKSFIHPTAAVDKTAVIGENVFIGAHVSIGKNVKIGDSTVIMPNVTIYDNCRIGNNVILHAGVVIGSDGFGFVPTEKEILKVPQLGRAIIEDNVEIGANSCVDRGTFTDTVIGKDTKIDNLVQVAHNVKIGERVFLAALTGIGGSSEIGDNTIMGGQAGISDHIKIGKNVKIGAKTGVLERNVPDGSVHFGYPSKNAREAFKQIAFQNFLFKNAKKVMSIIKKLAKEDER